MNYKIGEKIIKTVHTLSNSNLNINHTKQGDCDTYNLISNNYKVTLILDPKRWLGLEFYLLDSNGKIQLTYDLDTDLYPISSPKYLSTTKIIEDKIVEFLYALVNKNIKIGQIKGKTAMIIPEGEGYLLLKKGRFITSSKFYSNLNEIDSVNTFHSI
jgi:hypothetical protein